jgi:putative PIN family toxin of toxin-antitoxin system
MRVVIDTNVLISAIFWGGKPKRLLNAVRRREMIFLVSESLLEELEEVLTAEDKPFNLEKESAQRIVRHLREIARPILIKSTVSICRDEDDNRVLECALDGMADYIITGDKDLLDLVSFEGIKIVKVADFLGSIMGR